MKIGDKIQVTAEQKVKRVWRETSSVTGVRFWRSGIPELQTGISGEFEVIEIDSSKAKNKLIGQRFYCQRKDGVVLEFFTPSVIMLFDKVPVTAEVWQIAKESGLTAEDMEQDLQAIRNASDLARMLQNIWQERCDGCEHEATRWAWADYVFALGVFVS